MILLLLLAFESGRDRDIKSISDLHIFRRQWSTMIFKTVGFKPSRDQNAKSLFRLFVFIFLLLDAQKQ